MGCEHKKFSASIKVNRLEDTRQFTAEVRIECSQCGEDFQFLGLEPGFDLGGAMVSIDGLEAVLAIAPASARPNPLQRMGYGIKRFDG